MFGCITIPDTPKKKKVLPKTEEPVEEKSPIDPEPITPNSGLRFKDQSFGISSKADKERVGSKTMKGKELKIMSPLVLGKEKKSGADRRKGFQR